MSESSPLDHVGDAGSFHSQNEDSFHASSPFFADAMLDLDTAHDLAETPDASQFQRKTIVPPPNLLEHHADLQLPSTDTTNSSSLETPRRRLKPSLDGSGEEGHPSTLSLVGVGSGGTSTNKGSLGSPAHDNNNNNNTPEKHEMVRITNRDSLHRRGVQSLRSMRLLWSSLPKSRPTWPRDWAWALAFCIVVPLALAGPLSLAQPQQEIWTKPPLSTATFWAWWGSAGAAALTTRWMYGRRWTDEDRSSRHERVAAGLVSFAAWSVVVYLVLAVTIFIRLPGARWATLLPVAYTVRDVYLVRRWKARRGVITHASSQAASPTSSSSSYASRYAFFQALTAMALDILAKSLRRASFFRVLSFILLTQTLVIGLWRQALIGALDDESAWLLVLAAVGGKWATGTLARLLSLIASGGVVNWFVQQQEQYPQQDDGNGGQDFGDVELSAPYSDNNNSNVPEAYRTVGASVYQSILRMEDVMDDEDDDDEEEEFHQEVQQESGRPQVGQQESLSTVRGMLLAGLSVSFGSVAMCGLLGGPAQFVWSQIRKVNIWVRTYGRVRLVPRARVWSVWKENTSKFLTFRVC